MSFTQKLALLAAPAALFLIASPALAAPAPTSSEWYDLDHDGRLDRAIVTLSNPAHESLAVADVSKLKITYNGAALTPTAAYFASTGNPARLVLTWKEYDANLPVDTAVTKFEINWPDFGIATGLKKIDKAAPILLSSTPVAGTVGASRTQDLVLNFSEPIDQTSFAWNVVNDSDGWTNTWSADGKSVDMAHGQYHAGAGIDFTVTTANDAVGNAIVPGATYPNPFHFNSSSSDFANNEVSPQFLINEPQPLSTLKVGLPSVLAWYTNDPTVVQVKLSWSTDGGGSYRLIATVPAKDGSYVWYPPNQTGSFLLKAEGLGTAGTTVALDVHNPLTLASSTGVNPIELEAATPPLPAAPAQPTTPTTPVTTTPISTPILPAPISPIIIAPIVAPDITTAPTVTGFDLKAKTAVLTWQTDAPSTSIVIYGLRKDYSHELRETTLTTDHRLILTGLTPGAMHNVRVTVIGATGGATATGDIFFQFLKEGDRIKGQGPAVYWWKGGVKRLFPNPKTYLYWFKSWNGIITIGDTQLNWLPTGAPVKIGKTP